MAIISCHVAMLAIGAARNSPTRDEIGFLAAAISHWRTASFNLYRVNPPLPRMVSAWPAMFAAPTLHWDRYVDAPGNRFEFILGRQCIQENGRRYLHILRIARWSGIVWSVIGAWTVFRWACDLYGPRAALTATTFWCVCPNILGHGQLLTADIPATSMGLVAAHGFWKWTQQMSGRNAIRSGVALGLCLLTKLTWIILIGLWPLFAAVVVWRPSKVSISLVVSQLVLMLAIGLAVLNAGYLFSGTFKRLGDYTFVSDTLAGDESPNGRFTADNRFQGSWMGMLPIPLPRDYVLGVDIQRSELERTRLSYFRGVWRERGWLHYYVYGLSVKVPLGVWAMVLASTICWGHAVLCKHYANSTDLSNDLIVMGPGIALVVLVSSQTGFNEHVRYVFPALPGLYIWASRIVVPAPSVCRACFIGGAIAWCTVSSLAIFPHSMSYFNEAVGGPRNGHKHLLSSNLDWGQDMLFLKQWSDKNPKARPLGCYCLLDNAITPELLAMEAVALPSRRESREEPVQPGWYAISVCRLLDPKESLDVFLGATPVATIGYSINIYRVPE